MEFKFFPNTQEAVKFGEKCAQHGAASRTKKNQQKIQF